MRAAAAQRATRDSASRCIDTTGGGPPLPLWAAELLPSVATERELQAALLLLRHLLQLQQQQQRVLAATKGDQQHQQAPAEAPWPHRAATTAPAALTAEDAIAGLSGAQDEVGTEQAAPYAAP